MNRNVVTLLIVCASAVGALVGLFIVNPTEANMVEVAVGDDIVDVEVIDREGIFCMRIVGQVQISCFRKDDE